MSRTTVKQTERILKYIRNFGSITQLEALSDLGVMRLASRIADLKSEGHGIHKDMVCSKNRYGEPIHYARYSLVKEENNE